ncbi:unnamed protein product [Triticum turgidum subsp. durum]|uniref:Uncharacterized protein n=1 Tax=Triticum turgidum subsp. durum TaxID=4567 RepID=A0A9R1B811_TRITD|nr:unnamed protein product [Triticum turgidum subsp. durum]
MNFLGFLHQVLLYIDARCFGKGPYNLHRLGLAKISPQLSSTLHALVFATFWTHCYYFACVFANPGFGAHRVMPKIC